MLGAFTAIPKEPKKISVNPLYLRHPRSMNPYTDLNTALTSAQIHG
jgi:hypothetical protein